MSVYFIHSPDTALIKIGYAQNPHKRLGKMQVDSPTRLILLAVEDGGKSVEATRHAQFAEYRARGEWFKDHPALRFHIDALPPYSRPKRQALPGPLGEWLRNHDHTLTSFAALVGTTEASLSRICNGKQFPRRDLMLGIYRATGGEIDANVLVDILPRTRSAAA